MLGDEIFRIKVYWLTQRRLSKQFSTFIARCQRLQELKRRTICYSSLHDTANRTSKDRECHVCHKEGRLQPLRRPSRSRRPTLFLALPVAGPYNSLQLKLKRRKASDYPQCSSCWCHSIEPFHRWSPASARFRFRLSWLLLSGYPSLDVFR